MERPPFLPRGPRVVAAIVALSALYFAAGKLGLSLALVNTSATAVWPPTGIAIAALLLFGSRLWPGVLIGAFLVNVSTTYGLGSSIGIAVGNTLEAAVFLFGGTQELSINREPLAFLSFPVLVWAAARFGPRETTAVLLVLAAIADWGTLRGFGPFARADVNSSLLLLQGFMTVAAITSDGLAAAIVDRRRAEEVIRSTEHRLRTVAEEAARVREEFLSIATHELRTPVTSVRGYAQLAQRSLDRDPNADVRRELETIVRQSDRLAALIAQLLDASQLQAGTLTPMPVRTDVSALAREATAVAEIADSHRLVVDITPGIWADVDPVRFEEILANLIDNARKFTPAGGAIAVRLGDEGDELELSVADEGPGIPSDRLANVLDPFYRAHDA